MATLQRAGLVTSRRLGQWTYYKRDEERTAALARRVGADLSDAARRNQVAAALRRAGRPIGRGATQ